ncbi:hypothetical protein F2Q70_00034596 [Brassica cretica]|uniref:Pentatricopeptide repeat-containing protein n=1 Tax=Brassica cretica TaxID=69181 RepID=A0A8S9JYU8_BRACR|nr:hypothetical protein F2Q70_00034596 [Brassica cretica]
MPRLTKIKSLNIQPRDCVNGSEASGTVMALCNFNPILVRFPLQGSSKSQEFSSFSFLEFSSCLKAKSFRTWFSTQQVIMVDFVFKFSEAQAGEVKGSYGAIVKRKEVKKVGKNEHHLWKKNDSAGSGQKALNLVRMLSGLPNEKEAVYGALNKWVAWEVEFPIVAAAKALQILRKRSQWHRVIQLMHEADSQGQNLISLEKSRFSNGIGLNRYASAYQNKSLNIYPDCVNGSEVSRTVMALCNFNPILVRFPLQGSSKSQEFSSFSFLEFSSCLKAKRFGICIRAKTQQVIMVDFVFKFSETQAGEVKGSYGAIVKRKEVKKVGKNEHHLWKKNDSAGSGQKALNLVRMLSGLPNEKEAVYGALNKWVAWEVEFPIVAAAKALQILRKRSQWHRVIQVYAYPGHLGYGHSKKKLNTHWGSIKEFERGNEGTREKGLVFEPEGGERVGEEGERFSGGTSTELLIIPSIAFETKSTGTTAEGSTAEDPDMLEEETVATDGEA